MICLMISRRALNRVFATVGQPGDSESSFAPGRSRHPLRRVSLARDIHARLLAAVACAWVLLSSSATAQDRYGFGDAASRVGQGASPRATDGLLTGQGPVSGAVPVIDVRVEGNRTIPSSQVFGQLTTRAGRRFDSDVVSRDVTKLMKLGWFAYVRPLYQETPQGLIVIFDVTERPIIRYVNYFGRNKVKQKKLAELTGLKSNQTLDPYRVQEGIRKIEEHYKSKGFNRVQVTALEGLKPQDRGVTYVIHEGPRQKIWKVEFVGNDSGFASNGRLKTLIQSKPGILWYFKGDVDRQKIDADLVSIERYYKSFGYFQAKVGRELDFNEEGNWLTLRFVIHEGPRFKIRNVSIAGNEQFGADALQQRLQLTAGEPFEATKLGDDQTWLQDLYGSQGYVFADIQAETQISPATAEVDIVYNIAEGKRWRVGRVFVHIGGDNPHTKTTVALNRITLAPGDIVDTREIKASERRLVQSNLFHRDPARGIAPRITYKIPELDGRTRPASAPGTTHRGQSPDQRGAGGTVRHTTNYRPTTPPPAYDMHLHFQNRAHYQQWWTGRPVAQAAAPVSHPQRVNHSGGVAVTQHPPAARPANSAYRDLLPSQGATPASRGTNQLAADYRDRTPPREVPRLLYRGQNESGWSSPITFGGMGVRSTGPDATTAPSSDAAPVRVAQGSPAFDPNLPLSPNAPGALPGPITPGQVYSSEPLVNPFTDPRVDIYVDVEETQTGRFMAGVGVNSDAGVVGSIVIDERNFDWRRVPTGWNDIGNAFRGGGQHFRLEAAPGSQVQRYLASWQDPYWRGTPFSLGLAGSFFDRRFRDWDEQRLGGRVSFGYQWPRRDLAATIAYRGESVNIHDPFIPSPPELAAVVGDNVLHGFRASLTNDTRDSSFLATTGHYVEMSFEQVIGTFSYPRAVLDLRKYLLVRQRPDRSGRHVISYSTRLGFTGSNTPIYEHFFAGGYSTLRGFDFRGASPVNGSVQVGGEFMWINSLEYLLPITADDMFHMVGFVDFGTVEPGVEINDFRVSPGLGVRITVPAMGPAPIALDFAWPVLKADFDDREVFSFHIGLQRL